MPASDCTGTDCTVILHKTSDPVAETFQNTDADTRPYALPKPDSGFYGAAFYPAMRDAFDRAARGKMAEYTHSMQGCPKSCTCSPSIDPADRTTVRTRIRVSATYDYPDGSGSATVAGTFLLESTRINGFCVPGEGIPEEARIGREGDPCPPEDQRREQPKEKPSKEKPSKEKPPKEKRSKGTIKDRIKGD